MKIALICDTHFGIRGNNFSFLDYQEDFFNDVFFPELEKRGIKTILHLGDLVDQRKSINYFTLKRMKEMFLDRLTGYDVTFICGNHDIFFRNSNSLSALSELLGSYYFRRYSRPLSFFYYSRPVCLIPWITSENKLQTEDVIHDTPAEICLGHLELSGFPMDGGMIAEYGDDPLQYKKFKSVLSGHYHTKSKSGNIQYLGAPFQFTWADHEQEKGFHILDLDTLDLEYIVNPYTLFHQIVYDGKSPIDFNQELYFNNSYVKIIAKKKDSQAEFERFVKAIEGSKPLDIKIVELADLQVTASDITGMETTTEIIRKYINELSVDVDKSKLEELMLQYYKRSQEIEI